MADDPNITEPRTSVFNGLRKITFLIGIFFVLWILFGQTGPRLLSSRLHSPAMDRAALKPVNIPESRPGAEEQSGAAPRVDQLEARIKTLEDVIAALPKTGETSPTPESSAKDERIDRLESQLKAQEATLAEMKTQLTAAQSRSNRELAALTAFGALKDAVLRGEPIDAPLNQLADLTPDNAGAQELLAKAKLEAGGAETLAALQRRFDAMLPEALAAGRPAGMMSSLQSLIRIRKTGDGPGTDDESVLARAEASVSRGDIDQACRELAALSPPAGSLASAWVSRAEAWLDLRRTLDALQLALATPQSPPAALRSGFNE